MSVVSVPARMSRKNDMVERNGMLSKHCKMYLHLIESKLKSAMFFFRYEIFEEIQAFEFR